MRQTAGSDKDRWMGAGLGGACAVLISGALATSSPAHYLPIAVGVGLFIVATFLVTRRLAPKR